MIFSPHRLQKFVVLDDLIDDDGNPIDSLQEWEDVGTCRCDDNGVMKQVSVNGKLFDYHYHIVYEGEKIPTDTLIKVLDKGQLRAEGKVIKSAKCNFFNYTQIWL